MMRRLLRAGMAIAAATLLSSVAMTSAATAASAPAGGSGGVLDEAPAPLLAGVPADKVAALDALASSSGSGTSGSGVEPLYSAGSRTLSVVVQRQATSYYCVPASTRVTLSAFVSTLPSQQTLAGRLGTTSSGTYMSHVPAVVNSYESRNYYVFNSTASLTDLRDRIQIDIQSYRSPLQNQVQMSLLPWYAGSISGNHDIATYGYYYATKVANAYVYDPWTDSRAGRKTIGTSDLYDAGAPYSHNLVW